VAGAVAVTVLAGGALAVLTGTVGIVTASGRSMNPGYRQGDLVVVAAAEAYAPGQVVAYRDNVHDLVVLHRIVGGGPEAFELKGDANAAADAVRPARSDVIGRAVLHVPGGGAWLGRLTSPVPLGVAALVLVAATARRRPRSPAMSRNVRSAVLMAGLAGVGLGAAAFTTPARAIVPRDVRSTRSMPFAYAAGVARSAAYDGTTARSPDPVFRRLANAVDVHLAYDGTPGTLAVAAELSADSGWHATIALAAPRDVPGRYDATVRLDLAALERHARDAAAVTGLPVEVIAVAVTPRVTGSDGAAFAPALRLTLTPLRLALAGGPATLTVADTSTVRVGEPAARRLGLLSRSVTVATARRVAAFLLLGTLLAALALALVARRSATPTEGERIRRRYASRLLRVQPLPATPGDAAVDVVEFADLAGLAERHCLPVLHWSRGEAHTFVVREQGTTYRYRTA